MPFLRSEGESQRADAGEEPRDARPARRFEYHVLRVGTQVRAEPQLNDLGRKGWQLVQVVAMEGYLAFYLEREVVVEDDAEA